MKKIIITGATSMIGTALTEIAVRKGNEVYAVVRPDTRRMDRLAASPLIHIVYGSLEKLGETEGLPEDCDVFYHFAWAGTNRQQRDDPFVQEANIRYTLDAVELAKKTGCRRFIGAGSQAEYGRVSGTISDTTKCEPLISYGMAKFAAGKLSAKLCEKLGIEHIWGRIFSVYGPHDNDGTMLRYALSCFMNGETAHFSAAEHKWNYLYESDAGEIFYRLGAKDVPGGVYPVAHSESAPLKEYIKIMQRVFGEEAKAEFAGASSSDVIGLDADAGKTFAATGFSPCVSFEEGIVRMAEYLRERSGNNK